MAELSGAEPSDIVADIEAAAGSLVEVWYAAGQTGGSTVSPAQLRALRVVERRPGLTVAELADQLSTISSWASRLCDRLEAEGYLERRPSAAGHGRRHLELRLRPDGLRLLVNLQRRRQEGLAVVLSRMTVSERAALARGLRGFARASSAPPARAAETA